MGGSQNKVGAARGSITEHEKLLSAALSLLCECMKDIHGGDGVQRITAGTWDSGG